VGSVPKPVEVRLNGATLKAFVPAAEMSVQAMTAEAALWRRVNVLQIVPVSSDAGPLLAVDRFRFERLE
jgi:hypothetical protein